MDSDQKCSVHGTILKLMKVSVSYGLPARDEELWEARTRLFPNAKSFVLGGCIVGSIGYETEEMVCDECRKAERAWEKKNP